MGNMKASAPLLEQGAGRAHRRSLVLAATAAAGAAGVVCLLVLVSAYPMQMYALVEEDASSDVHVDGDIVSIRNPETGVYTVSMLLRWHRTSHDFCDTHIPMISHHSCCARPDL